MKIANKLNLLLEDERNKTANEFVIDKANNVVVSLDSLMKQLGKSDPKAQLELSSMKTAIKSLAAVLDSKGLVSGKKKSAELYREAKATFKFTLNKFKSSLNQHKKETSNLISSLKDLRVELLNNSILSPKD